MVNIFLRWQLVSNFLIELWKKGRQYRCKCRIEKDLSVILLVYVAKELKLLDLYEVFADDERFLLGVWPSVGDAICTHLRFVHVCTGISLPIACVGEDHLPLKN